VNVIAIDWTRCDGHGLCAALLPAHIDRDEWGYPVLHDTAGAREHELRRVVAACPSLALRLTQRPHSQATTQVTTQATTQRKAP
jgi:ferredoxin